MALQEKASLLAEKKDLEQELQKTYCVKAIFLKAAFGPMLLEFLFTYQYIHTIAVASVTHSPLYYYAYILTCHVSSLKCGKGEKVWKGSSTDIISELWSSLATFRSTVLKMCKYFYESGCFQVTMISHFF